MKSTESPISDDRIIEMYFERDEVAIKETDSKYGKYLAVIGYNILRDKWDSAECLNDTYFATWNKIPPERPNIFQAFLSRIMRNISISRYRRKYADKRMRSELVESLEELDDCIVSEANVEEDVLVRELADILNGFLKNVDKRTRFIFVCRYYYCDSVKCIAEMLSLSQQTVYRELAAVRARLRHVLRGGETRI